MNVKIELELKTLFPDYIMVDNDNTFFYLKKEGIGVVEGHLTKQGDISKLVVEKFGKKNKLFSGKNSLERAKIYLEGGFM